MLRLRSQAASPDGHARAESNRIAPGGLNELERRMRECLRQAGKLQTRLALDYQL